jgi:hypothetical protein
MILGPMKRLLLLLLSLSPILRADGTISTYIGATAVDHILASAAVLGNPAGMAVDGVGNIYLADTGNNRIRRIDSGSGIIDTIAGTGIAGYDGDNGPALQAELNQPSQVALLLGVLGSNSYLFVADTQNHRIRRINLSTGIIDTVAGNGVAGFSGDGGLGIYASLNGPVGVACDGSGSNLYISDTQNNCVRELNITSDAIMTVAGMHGNPGYGGDGGAATSAALSTPLGCFVGPSGDLYIADPANARIRRVDGFGNITSVAGSGAFGYSGDGGPALSAAMTSPNGVFVDISENVYVADVGSFVVREVLASSQNITTLAGTGVQGYSGDGGPARQAELGGVLFALSDVLGNLLILDGNNSIRKVAVGSGTISTIAGFGQQQGLDANLVQLSLPQAVNVMPGGDFLVSDSQSNRIRRVSASSHQISTFAGNGSGTSSGDGGAASLAGLPVPGYMTVAPNGTVYVSEPTQGLVRSINSAGTITRVAGTGTPLYSASGGQATATGLGVPFGVCVSGNYLYVSEHNAQVIRRIDLGTGIITLYAGIPSSPGLTNGPALSAQFNIPYDIVADPAGNIYVSDAGNNMVRKISAGPSPTVSTICGLGPSQGGYNGDGGPAVAAALNGPAGLYLDAQGDLYICDVTNSRIRRIDAQTGMISSVAGQGLQGYAGDGGPALAALLNHPQGVAVDGQGSVFVADAYNNVVRKVSYAQTPLPTPVESAPNKAVAYPSPASDHICFSYQAPQSGKVTINIYNSALQLAAQIEDTVVAGSALTCGNIQGLASGAYIYRIVAPGAGIAPNKFKVVR